MSSTGAGAGGARGGGLGPRHPARGSGPRRCRRRSLGRAQLVADFGAQRQQAPVVGNLPQTLFDLQQAAFVSPVALVVQRLRQKFLGLPLVLLSFGLSTGGFLLILEFGLARQYFLLERQQAVVFGHGPQALFDVGQADIQRPFLSGALSLFEKLLRLQFRLLSSFLPGANVGQLLVDFLA